MEPICLLRLDSRVLLDELDDLIDRGMREVVSAGFFGSHRDRDDFHIVACRLQTFTQQIGVLLRRNDAIVLRYDVQQWDFGGCDFLRVIDWIAFECGSLFLVESILG